MTVAELLSASRTAHARYRNIHDATQNTDKAGMREALLEARDARQAAHNADADHRDPAWAIDVFPERPVSHEDLMIFYEAYLATH